MISLNRSWAVGSALTSGCHCWASLRNARLMSASLAVALDAEDSVVVELGRGHRLGSIREDGPCEPLSRRPARALGARTPRSIGAVSLPVNVFCWLGWNEPTIRYAPAPASAPWPNRGCGRDVDATDGGDRPEADSQANAPSATTPRPDRSSSSSRTRYGRQCRAPRASAGCPAGRTGRRPRCTRRRRRPSSTRRLRRLVRKPDGCSDAEQEVARRVAGEHAARAVAAVRRRREADDEDPRRRDRRSPAPAGPSTARRGTALTFSRRDLARATRRAAGSAGTRRSRRSGRPGPRASSGNGGSGCARRRRYLSSSLSSRRDTTTRPTRPIAARYATWNSSDRRDRPERQRADQVHALVQRRQLDDDPERLRIGVERKERAREQEHRQHDELDQVEVLPGPHERRGRHADRPEREARSAAPPGRRGSTHGEMTSPSSDHHAMNPIA